MDKMIVAVFEAGMQAAAAGSAMTRLSNTGACVVYAFAVVVPDDQKNGIVEFSNRDYADPLLGAATQRLVDLIVHPPTESRAIRSRLAQAGVDQNFLDRIGRYLLPGKAAVVAEIEEQRTTALDMLLETHGSVGFRCARRETCEAEIASALNSLRREIQNLQRRLQECPAESKPELREQLDLSTGRFRSMQARARQHAADIKRETEAKIISLQVRASHSGDGSKAAIERLLDDVRADYVDRATKLNLAWQFAGAPL
ncbi:MAG TPA: hypothetical protein VIB79_30530 [Candidatus Binatia bacterium]